MIVKNEEEVLARCLESAANLVDEIIIVDTGSDDRTVEIAKGFTPNVYTFEWIDDFAAARNFSFSKATKEYCMWLDADDVIEKPQQKLFLEMKASMEPGTDIVMMKYNTSFDEHGAPTFSYFRERIIRNDGTHHWGGQVHEAVVPSGKVVYSEVAVSHKKLRPGDPDRNLNIYRNILAAGGTLEPRHQYYYARELYYHKLYTEALAALMEFLDMKDGWMENKIEACSIASYCCDQLELKDQALPILFQSFLYDRPRAEICCDIGKQFMGRQEHVKAAYWYERALDSDKRERSGGFIMPDCYDYLPYIQLCVCYDRMGKREKAIEYNEKAGAAKPGSKAYLWNKQYFEKDSGV